MTTAPTRAPVTVAMAVLALGLVSACAAPPPPPEDKFYRLDVLAPQAEAPALHGVVEVERFVAAGALANRPLLYADPGSNAVSEYHYHFWLEPPPILLQSALVSYLRSDGLGSRVVTPEMRVDADYTVLGRVIRLETVHSNPPVGTVAFELALRREADRKLLVVGEYRAEVPSNATGIHTDVAAIERAVDEAFARFVADIRSAAKAEQ